MHVGKKKKKKKSFCSRFKAEMCLMDAAVCVLRCWEQWQSSCLGEWREQRGCLSACLRQRKREEGFVGVWVPLGDKVGQAGFNQRRDDSRDLQQTHEQSPGSWSGDKMSTVLLLSCKHFRVAWLIYAQHQRCMAELASWLVGPRRFTIHLLLLISSLTTMPW